MITQLYLVRHGETDWNRQGRCQGSTDIELNAQGRKQAQAVADRLSGESIELVFSSELKRAFETASIIGKKLKLEVGGCKGLNEISFGAWEGLTGEEMKAMPDYDYNAWANTPHCAVIPGEGSLKNVQERAMLCVNEIIRCNPGKNIVIVSHGGIIKPIILGVLGIGLEAYNRFYMSNASLSILCINKTMAYIKNLNDTCHLRDNSGVMPIF